MTENRPRPDPDWLEQIPEEILHSHLHNTTMNTNKYVLKDRGLIDAAIVDIDNRQSAQLAREEFAAKHGGSGFKVVIAAQDSANSTGHDVQAVTLIKFDKAPPRGFVSMGQDADGRVLALPDLRTTQGEAIAREMGNLPEFTNRLSAAMGFVPKVEGGRVSFGISSVEEVGRDIVLGTRQDLTHQTRVEPLSDNEYQAMKGSVARAKKMAADQVPTPFTHN